MIICIRKGCVYNDGNACKAPNIRISMSGYCQRYSTISNAQPDPTKYLNNNAYNDFLKAMDEVNK